MKAFLTLTAIIEGTTGLILLLAPSLFVSFLLNAVLSGPGTLLARLAGVALLSIAIACWAYRSESPNSSGIIKAVLFYNIAAGSLLVYSYIAGFSGMGLWPAAILHFVFAIWCIQLFTKKS